MSIWPLPVSLVGEQLDDALEAHVLAQPRPTEGRRFKRQDRQRQDVKRIPVAIVDLNAGWRGRGRGAWRRRAFGRGVSGGFGFVGLFHHSFRQGCTSMAGDDPLTSPFILFPPPSLRHRRFAFFRTHRSTTQAPPGLRSLAVLMTEFPDLPAPWPTMPYCTVFVSSVSSAGFIMLQDISCSYQGRAGSPSRISGDF